MKLNEKTQRIIAFISLIVMALSLFAMCTASFIYMTATPANVSPQIYETMWDIWAARIVAFLLILLLCVFLPVTSVYLRITDRKYRHAENMERIRRKQEENQPKIVLNQATRVNNGEDVLVKGVRISIEKIGMFVKNAMEVGLAISAWRDNGFTQTEIEAILDHLAELGVITERTQGVSCAWRREIDTMRLARYFPVETSELVK